MVEIFFDCQVPIETDFNVMSIVCFNDMRSIGIETAE